MSPVVLRVLTLNLQHGRPAAGVASPAQALRGLAREVAALEPDLLLLQEVDRAQRRSGGLDQAAVLADAAGLPYWRFAASFTGPAQGLHRRPRTPLSVGGSGYGVALASRYPVTSWHVRRLQRSRPRVRRRNGSGWQLLGRYLWLDGARVCLAASVCTPAGPMGVAVTHLSTDPPTARRQLGECAHGLARLPGPHLLGGDLNLEPDQLGATALVPLATALTFTNRRPRRQLDHLLGGPGLVGHRAQAHHLSVSDHAALGAEVTRDSRARLSGSR